MATKAALEKRLSGLEAKTKPKMIETLADWVLWLANSNEGEERPPLSEEMEDCFKSLAEKAERRKQEGES